MKCNKWANEPFWQISHLIRFYLYICGETTTSWMFIKTQPPVRASARPAPDTHTCTHTNTHHFLWLGKGSYWRILSGKRTFSNKWWWTLDENTLLAHLFLSPQFIIHSFSFVLVYVCQVEGCRQTDLDPEFTSPSKNHAHITVIAGENVFLHVWRWERDADGLIWSVWTVCELSVWDWCCTVWKPVTARRGSRFYSHGLTRESQRDTLNLKSLSTFNKMK